MIILYTHTHMHIREGNFLVNNMVHLGLCLGSQQVCIYYAMKIAKSPLV